MKINNDDVKFENGCYQYFACTCAEKDLQFWQEELEKFYEDENPTTLRASGLFMWLEHEHDAWVTGIDSDMWFGVTIESKKHKFYIQCDYVEYGLLAAIKILEMLEESEND